MNSSKQDPLYTPIADGGKGLCLNGTVRLPDRRCHLFGFRAEREVYRWTFWEASCLNVLIDNWDWNIWSPTHQHATGRQVPLCPDSHWGGAGVGAGASLSRCSMWVCGGMQSAGGWLGPAPAGGAAVAVPVIHKQQALQPLPGSAAWLLLHLARSHDAK